MTFEETMNSLGISLASIFAGMCGGFVFRPKGKFTWKEFIIRILSGAFCANYLTPVVFKIIPMLEGVNHGTAFIIGYGGVHVADYILEFIKNKTTKNGKTNEDHSEGGDQGE